MPFRAKLNRLSACPAVLFIRKSHGSFLCYCAIPLYILFLLFRILTAASTSSRSIRFPHSHRYIRSDNASSFLLMSAYAAYLTGCKTSVYLSDIFHVLPAYIQAWKGTDRIQVILYPCSYLIGFHFTARFIFLTLTSISILMDCFQQVL